jgi:hypothetical protein
MAGYGDVRLESRGDELIERISGLGTLVLRKLGGDRAGEIGAHRFLSSPRTSVEVIIDTLAERTRQAAQGLEVVCAQDTTDLNFGSAHGDRGGLGACSNGMAPGFFAHALVAIDGASERVLGLSGAHIWSRSQKPVRAAWTRHPEDKESIRWLGGLLRARDSLAGAARITVVGDRENDIYHVFANRPTEVEMIVRARHNRTLILDGQERRPLFETLAQAPVQTIIDVEVAPKGPGDRGRVARVELRKIKALIAPARDALKGSQPVSLFAIEAKEIDPPSPKSNARPALHWILVATQDRDPADIVRLYKLRWRIEEVFRALKRDGLAFGETQVRSPERLFKLAALALGAAARTIQLVDARDGGNRPDTDVIDPAFRPALQAISKKLEGKTQRQKNPHPINTLSFVSWICARLGGWNCYYKPPGPKTMRDGWNKLTQQLSGFAIAHDLKSNNDV